MSDRWSKNGTTTFRDWQSPQKFLTMYQSAFVITLLNCRLNSRADLRIMQFPDRVIQPFDTNIFEVAVMFQDELSDLKN